MGTRVSQARLAAPVAARLRQARKARGLTIGELADAIGVSRQAVSQFELGHTTPSGMVLAQIVERLDFPLVFFTEPYQQANESAAVFFRSLASATKASREMGRIRLDWLQRIVAYLEQYLELPAAQFPQASDVDPEKLSSTKIESIAKQVRRDMGLGNGPISNMTLLLEKKGAIVTRISLQQLKLDAFSQWRDGRPYIFLFADKASAVRSRFDVAHELGHLVLHRWVDSDQMEDHHSLKVLEQQAHRFAGAFLLPQESFASEVMSTSLQHFIVLKRRWGVSIQAMLCRCEDLGLLSDNQVLYLRKQLSRQGLRQREPLDDELESETPVLLRQSITTLIENGVTGSEILDALKLSLKDVEALCGLDPGLLASEGRLIPISIKRSPDRSQL